MDISSLNIKGLMARAAPQGPSVDDDTALTVTGAVLEVDPAGRRVRVAIRGGDVWLPAVAGLYSASSLAVVLVDPTSARPVRVLGPVAPRAPAEVGKVTAVGDEQVTVELGGVAKVLPAVAGKYAVGSAAWLMLDPWGVPVLALGPTLLPPKREEQPPPPPPSGTESVTVTIGPQSSGTFRPGYGWSGWNPNRFGGVADIYQGNAYGSGDLVGFAGYGDLVPNLGALSIDEMILTAKRNGSGSGSAALVVQGTGLGEKPGGNPTAGPFERASSGAIDLNGSGTIALPAGLREAFRTGAARGLIAVGSQYGGFGGTSVPGSFVLQIRYTRNA
ncbi:hypothetical protein [Microbacterium arborescens]